jgi:hypothetical protein
MVASMRTTAAGRSTSSTISGVFACGSPDCGVPVVSVKAHLLEPEASTLDRGPARPVRMGAQGRFALPARAVGEWPDLRVGRTISASDARFRRRRGANVMSSAMVAGPDLARRARSAGPTAMLPCTADPTHGVANLLTRPRAGNISSDTRAGA